MLGNSFRAIAPASTSLQAADSHLLDIPVTCRATNFKDAEFMQ